MHYSPLAAFPFLAPLGLLAIPLVGLVIVWTVVIKGLALWKSARNSDKVWFIVILIVNTLGILELVYLIWIAKRNTPVVSSVGADVSSTPEVQ